MVGAAGAVGTTSAIAVTTFEKGLYPIEFLDSTLRLYVLPEINPVTVYDFILIPEATTM